MKPDAKQSSSDLPEISADFSVAVVIPTYNRWDCLEATLECLLKQALLPDEVIVVDDGSTDGTWPKLEAWQKSHACPYRFAIYTQENAGPAKARNLGVQQASSVFVAFLGDDTLPAVDWLQQHVACHRKLGPGYAVVGYTGWDSDYVRITPFLRYINGRGPQFGYDLMEDGGVVPSTCFYTSNISLPRAYLLAEPFDERFRLAGWEDSELGYRLSQRGMQIVYCEAAHTSHRHQTTIATFMRRQFNIGMVTLQMLEIHPELTQEYINHRSWQWRLNGLLQYPVFMIFPLIRILDYIRLPLPRRVYGFFLRWSYVKGWRGAHKEDLTC